MGTDSMGTDPEALSQPLDVVRMLLSQRPRLLTLAL